MLAGFKLNHAVVGLAAAFALLGFAGTSEGAELENPNAIEGIAGSYVRYAWLAPQGEIVSLSVAGAMEGPEFKGTYVRRVKRTCRTYGCDIETGRYFAVGGNPANGWAFIVFFGEGEEVRDIYVIKALNLNVFGNVQSMTIALWDAEEGAIGNDFVLSRLGF